MKLPKRNGISNLIVVLIVAALVGGGFYFFKGSQTKISTPTQIISSLPVPTPSPWKTYSADSYTITYPSKGVVVDEVGTHEGECGNAIKEQKIDNFFTIKVMPWTKSIANYLVSQGASKVYDAYVIEGTNADEALALDNLAKGVEYARGFPPLMAVKALYKKGDNLYIMQLFQTPNNFGGCVLPTNVDPVKYPEIAKQEWDPLTSLKFNP